MNKKQIIRQMSKFGLTKEEALLYYFLLERKSGTVKEIHDSKEYCLKQRPNLYKLINSLVEKGFVEEEIKGGKKRFFPQAPHFILNLKIEEKQKKLDELKELLTSLSDNLENVLKKSVDVFTPIPEIVLEFVSGVVNEEWSVKEPPEVIKTKDLGTIYSIEFNTHRKFSGNSAGIVINYFRYKEHRDESLLDVQRNLKEEMIKAFQRIDGHGPIKFLGYESSQEELMVKGINFKQFYTEFKIKTNLDINASSACTSFIFEDHLKKIISCWAADKEDFLELAEKMTKKFTPIKIERD